MVLFMKDNMGIMLNKEGEECFSLMAPITKDILRTTK
jgi:hypothetical protein